jgi:Protein of unknown function (DUF3553)
MPVEIRVGSYVTHPQRPEWGIGKVFCQCDKHVLVGFRNLSGPERFKRLERTIARLDVVEVSDDTVLDAWTVEYDSTCREVKAVAKATRASARKEKQPIVADWTRDEALVRFREVFKDGFQDPEYVRRERDWKWAKHQLWNETVAPDGFRALALSSPEQAQKLIEKMVQTKAAMLHPTGEIVPLRDAVHRPESATTYFNTLADLLEAPVLNADVFQQHVETLTSLPLIGKGNLSKWTIVTFIPFLAQPSRHMFLKPGRIKQVTQRLGVDIDYTPAPKWDTYERLLKFSNELLEFLKPHGAQDMIDVQSFIWAITATEDPPAKP